MVTTGATRRAKLQSNHHHQQTNTQCFTGPMPFLSPNQQCQSNEVITNYKLPRFNTVTILLNRYQRVAVRYACRAVHYEPGVWQLHELHHHCRLTA